MRSAIADKILKETPPHVHEFVRAYGKQRVRNLLCHLLKNKGKLHPATRTVIKNLLPKTTKP